MAFIDYGMNVTLSTGTQSSTGTQVWPSWNITYSNTSAWVTWTNTSLGTTAYTTTSSAWNVWNQNYVTSTGTTIRTDQRRERQYQFAASPSRCPEAEKRADKILVEHLSTEQERMLLEQGYFDVRTMVDGRPRRFRIHNHRYQHNVFELDENDVKIRELCAHTSHTCPQSDHALAQKLLLEHNPEEFLRVANIWDLQRDRALISQSGHLH